MPRFWKFSPRSLAWGLSVLGLWTGNTTAQSLTAQSATAQRSAEVPAIEVRAANENLTGLAQAGSEGVVSGARLATMPLFRPGEVLEMVPGLIVTQHAGDGKANQYFLRGFNLDHGTDFATYLDGMPLNMPSHAHGQGYTDLNFLIPELIDKVQYRKGPYSAEEGDFSSAGAARIRSLRQLNGHQAQMTLGPDGYQRGVLSGSPASGNWLYGLEWLNNNGPWQVPERNRKLNGVLRFSDGTVQDGYSVAAMAYRNAWTSTDQIPQRALDQGLISRYGSLDPTAGGVTSRYSLSGEWARSHADSQTRANVWLLQSALDLWSNFTYCLNDATLNCDTGDQFKQSERRLAAGLVASHAWASTWATRDVTHTVGVQGRQDQLSPVGLYNSRQREVLSTVREDRVQQRSLSMWAQTEVQWTPQLRSITGLRADTYDFKVQSNVPVNSGRSSNALLSPKVAWIWRVSNSSELYLNYGQGFHSNDARGTTIRVDPSDPSTIAQTVPGLVRTTGQELGWRSELWPGWQSTLVVWQLDSASELIFVGDAGTTEASRPSRRYGVEWTNLYKLHRHWLLDLDWAGSHARFKDRSEAGNFIPGAVQTTANVGLTYAPSGPWSALLRVRYFGPRPLIEDNSQQSAASWVSNARLSYKFNERTRLGLDVYNLLGNPTHDIEYLYISRLRGQAQALLDKHLHPAEPRTVRLTLNYRFE